MNLRMNEHLLELEQALKSKLHPVAPDQNFVSHLRQRLETIQADQKQRTLAVTLLSVAAGLAVGLVIFLIRREFIQDAEEA
jgi:hypothetical protein